MHKYGCSCPLLSFLDCARHVVHSDTFTTNQRYVQLPIPLYGIVLLFWIKLVRLPRLRHFTDVKVCSDSYLLFLQTPSHNLSFSRTSHQYSLQHHSNLLPIMNAQNMNTLPMNAQITKTQTTNAQTMNTQYTFSFQFTDDPLSAAAYEDRGASSQG